MQRESSEEEKPTEVVACECIERLWLLTSTHLAF